jgi:hypothetical protein
MRLVLRSLLLASCLLATSGAAAVPARGTASHSPAHSQEALRLAFQLVNIIHPDELMIRTNVETWESTTRKQIGQDPGFTKLEADYPGLSAAAIAGARPIALEFAREFVRDAKQTKTQIFVQEFTVAEMKQLITFFETPAGQRFIKKMASPDNAGGFIETLAAKAESGSGEITAKDLEKGMAVALPGIVKDTSSSDLIEIMRFESLPAAKKFAAAGTKADLAIFNLINEASAVWGPKLSDAMSQAALQFVERKNK